MIITEEKRIKDLADNIVIRTHEVYQYDLNISNYQTIINASSGEYPDHLLALKGIPYDQAIQQCSVEDLPELANLLQYERVSYLIKTEIIERSKANGILQVLSNQLRDLVGDEGYDAAIAEAVARRG